VEEGELLQLLSTPSLGVAQLRALGLQEGELLQLLPAPSLGLLPPLLGISCCIRLATGSLLGHLVSPSNLRTFTLEEGDLLDKAFYLFTSKG
jgi:hypothetical protein